MKITLKKNVLPFFAGDVTASIATIEAVQDETEVTRGQTIGGNEIDFGFEAIVRPAHMRELARVGENLKPCIDGGYELSIHAPLNFDEPERMDLVHGTGVDTARRLIDFADRLGIPLIVAHPGMIREPEAFANYSRQQQQKDLERLAKVARRLNENPRVCFSIENKPNPATDERNEGITTSPIATTYEHLAYLQSQGVPLTFDTAHYAITRTTINSIVQNAQKLGLEKVLEGIRGFFPEDCLVQPRITYVLDNLGDSIREVHLNDCVPYQTVGNVITYWEGLVPGRGNGVTNSDVIGFLKGRKTDTPIVMEVMETDYTNCPNTHWAMCNFLRELGAN